MNNNSIKVTFIICATILILFGGMYIATIRRNPGATVSVTGQSQLSVVPDTVAIYFYIETDGDTAQEAKDLNSEIYDDFLLNLVKEGIDSSEIETERYSVNPIYDWDDYRTIEGYRADHRIKIELPAEDSEDAGDIIDAGVDAGALVSYLNFELSVEKQNEYKAQAIEMAAEDARVKAEAMASGLNKRIGRVVSTSSSGFNYYPWMIYEAKAGADMAEVREASTNIQPGEESVNAQVSVTYALI